jgi:NDP-sugar pyrophosphorylase family protein
MQAVILAGGFGTRLEPVLKKLSTIKPMAPVLGKPFLEYILSFLRKSGVKDIVMCLYYMPEKVTSYFGNGSKFGVDIRYSYEKEPLKSAGALKNAEELLEDDFLLINGDNYFEIDYQKMLDFHKEKKALITLGTTSLENTKTRGICTTLKVENGRVIKEFGKEINAESKEALAGTFIIKKEILKNLKKGAPISLEKDILPKLIASGRVFSKLSSGYYIDIGTPKMYKLFIRDVKKGMIKL